MIHNPLALDLALAMHQERIAYADRRRMQAAMRRPAARRSRTISRAQGRVRTAILLRGDGR